LAQVIFVPSLSYESGKVVETRTGDNKFGNYIEIMGEKGGLMKYYHMQDIYLLKGELVQQGQIIGLSGNSGLVVKEGLGIEVFLNNKKIDPLDYIENCKIARKK